MPSTSIACGLLLILIGIIGFGYSILNKSVDEPAMKYITALIPAFLGIILALLGAAARSKENLRKHLMHVAVLIGLIGFVGTAGSFLKIPALLGGTADRPAAVVAQLATAIVSLVFVILCVKSFVDARRNRVA